MAELNDALTHLGPVDWNDVPQDSLEQYLTEIFTAGELICNSVPQVPEGTPFHDSKPHYHEPNTAKSHKEMHPSHARGYPPHDEHAKLAKQWGKPMKMKQNPLDVSLYKMAGHDRHGAWFARRSVHEGVGFDKFKRAMSREFPQSLSVNGGPGAGAIRGLAADRRLEQIDVKGVGRLEIYLLSSVFPGPVTPRDFVTLLLSSDGVLSDKSAAELEGGKRHVPRHFMLVSKPVQHPDAPARSGLVRGQYESVELIREVPITPAKLKSTPDILWTNGASEQHGQDHGHTVGTADAKGASASDQHLNVPASSGEGDPELNPVEWIMITRSDPGGGLPRFLVERGTPEPMIGDVHKFFDWACRLDHIPSPDEDLEEHVDGAEAETHSEDQVPSQSSQGLNGSNQQDSKTAPPNKSATKPVSWPESQGGIINNITKAIGTGIDAYAPAAVADRVGPYLNPGDADLSDNSYDTSSVDSFMSAEELRRMSTAPEQQKRPIDSTDVLSIASADLSDLPKDTKDMGHHEKEVYKITQKREKLEQQLARKRMEQEQRLKQTQEKEESETSKQKEEMGKKLKKTEDKHRKEMEKLEQKKAKELRKVEEKRKKKDLQHKLSLVARERDEFRSQVDLYRRESTLLQEQVADLQRQNTLMAQKLQPEALQSVKDEFGRNRKGSMKSVNSAASSRSNEKKTDAVS